MNRHISMEIVNTLDDIQLPRKERLALDCIVSAYPRYVQRDEAEQWMYEDVGDKDPENGSAAWSHVSKLRSKLRKLGFDT